MGVLSFGQKDVQRVDRVGDPRFDGVQRMSNAVKIPVSQIISEEQTRKEFDKEKLEQLSQSLQTDGQLQPIRVRYDEEQGIYVIISGERRWRAARLAGLETLDCVIASANDNEDDHLRKQIIENIQRDDLKPKERALAFKALMDVEILNITQLAERLNLNKATVSRSLALLDLPEHIQDDVDNGRISLVKALQAAKGSKAPQEGGRARRKPKKSREQRVVTDTGSVVVRSRRYLDPELIEQILTEALLEVRGQQQREAA